MRAVGNRLVVEKIEEENVTKSGLFLTGKDMDDRRYSKAVVVSAGEDVKGIRVGDEIHFDKVAGHTIMYNDKQLTIIMERDIVLVDRKLSLIDKLKNKLS